MTRILRATHGQIVTIVLACVIGLGMTIANPTSSVAESTVYGDIAADTTWTLAGSPYRVTGDIVVYGTDGPDHVTTLTINPGVVVRFDSNKALRIGNGNTPGRLVAKGTANSRITFTGSGTEYGWWKGILFDPGSSDGSAIDYAVVQYGGKNSSANIYLNNASPTISNSEIKYTDFYGIMCSGTDSTPTIVCNLITANRYGLYAQANSNPVVKYNTITKNSDYGVYNASTGLTLNVEYNWWGNESGPNTSSSGLNRIGGDVDFSPYLSAQPACPIPEWATITLVTTGLAGIAGYLWFRKRRRAKETEA